MVRRRDFVKAGAAAAAIAALPQRADADVPVHLWQGYDFGPGPKVADRLNQGPFGIEQDEGWFTVETTTASDAPVRNFGLGLVGYTWEENGPALAVRAGKQRLEDAVESLAGLPFVDVLYIRCDWRDVQNRPGRLDLGPVWGLTFDAAKRHVLRDAGAPPWREQAQRVERPLGVARVEPVALGQPACANGVTHTRQERP